MQPSLTALNCSTNWIGRCPPTRSASSGITLTHAGICSIDDIIRATTSSIDWSVLAQNTMPCSEIPGLFQPDRIAAMVIRREHFQLLVSIPIIGFVEKT